MALTAENLYDFYTTNGGIITTICVFLHRNFVFIIIIWS